MLRAAHYAGHELHQASPDLTQYLHLLPDDLLEVTARIAWAWANEVQRAVHVDRGDDDELPPLGVEVRMPEQLEIEFPADNGPGKGPHFANVSDPFFVVESVAEDSVLRKLDVRSGDVVLTVDGEDCASEAEFMRRVEARREMVWTVVRLTEVSSRRALTYFPGFFHVCIYRG